METKNTNQEIPQINVVEVKPTRIRNFLRTHKTKIAVVATATAAVVAHRAILKSYTDFLAEHDLLDEFHSDPWDDELVAAESTE